MDRQEQTTVNVIKRVSDNTGNRGVIKNQTLAARRDAEDIVAQARSEAETIIQNAVKKAELVLDKAYREGTERALTDYEKDLIAIREIRSRVMADVERDLLSLSVRIAEKIVGRELTSISN